MKFKTYSKKSGTDPHDLLKEACFIVLYRALLCHTVLSSSDLYSLGLSFQGQFDGEEGMALGHGIFRAVQAVQDELAEERKTNFAMDGEVAFALVVHEIDMIAFAFSRHIEVFSQFDIAIAAQHDGASIAPGAQPGGREPIHAEVMRRAGVGQQGGVTKILEVGELAAVVIGHLAVQHLGILGPGIEKKLLDLVAADVAQDAAGFFLLKKPGGPRGGIQPMRSKADDLEHPPNRPFLNQLPGINGGLNVKALRIIGGVFQAGLGGLAADGGQLFEGGQGWFVGEVIFAMVHSAQAQRSSQARHRRAGDQLQGRIIQNFLLRGGGFDAGIGFLKIHYLGGIRIIDRDQFTSGFEQSIAHAVNVSVIQANGRKAEISFGAYRVGLALGGIAHAISFLHNLFLCSAGSTAE